MDVVMTTINTNVGEMPLEIFGDYVSDILDDDWNWLYIIPYLNEVDLIMFIVIVP
jgi:hypothetical protein